MCALDLETSSLLSAFPGVFPKIAFFVLFLGPLRPYPFGIFSTDTTRRLDWVSQVLFSLFSFIMGPGRSSSLRIGGNSSTVASSGRTSGASDSLADVELRDAPGAPPFPLDKG